MMDEVWCSLDQAEHLVLVAKDAIVAAVESPGGEVWTALGVRGHSRRALRLTAPFGRPVPSLRSRAEAPA